MNSREIEQLEKKSILSLILSNDLKESVIQNYMNDLSKTVKNYVKKTELVILIIKKD